MTTTNNKIWHIQNSQNNNCERHDVKTIYLEVAVLQLATMITPFGTYNLKATLEERV